MTEQSLLRRNQRDNPRLRARALIDGRRNDEIYLGLNVADEGDETRSFVRRRLFARVVGSRPCTNRPLEDVPPQEMAERAKSAMAAMSS